MNNELIKIDNVDILCKEYKGERVVTFRDIDSVHQRPDGTAKRNFNDNKKHFIEGEDFFTIPYSEFCTEFVPNPPKGGNPNIPVNLMTESGYLMLVKSFTDDLAWDVQRKLVKSYFRAEKPKRTKRKPIKQQDTIKSYVGRNDDIIIVIGEDIYVVDVDDSFLLSKFESKLREMGVNQISDVIKAYMSVKFKKLKGGPIVSDKVGE